MTAMTTADVGRNMERDGKAGVQNPQVYYIALGTGNSTPSSANTKLDNEAFRKAVTSYASGATGVIVANLYVEPTEAVGITIAEVGIFGGSSASSTPNSGVLLGRGLYSPTHLKAATESMVIPVTIQYS